MELLQWKIGILCNYYRVSKRYKLLDMSWHHSCHAMCKMFYWSIYYNVDDSRMKWRYNKMSPLIGWTHTQNIPCLCTRKLFNGPCWTPYILCTHRALCVGCHSHLKQMPLGHFNTSIKCHSGICSTFVVHLSRAVKHVPVFNQVSLSTISDVKRLHSIPHPKEIEAEWPIYASSKLTIIVQIMAYRLFGPKPLPEPMLAYR